MSPYWIYSIGDSTMLANAFTGVSMVFNDHGNVASMVGMGLIFSLIVVGARAVIKQRFDLEYFFVGFLMYMALFVPKVTVNVEDAYTATDQAIDNIPIGLAVPMSMVTRVGHYLTTTYETAFSVPSMTTSGYLDSLYVLSKLDGFVIGSASSGISQSGEFNNSMTAYISQCALYDANNPSPDQEVSWSRLEAASDLWAAMETSFYNRFITTYIPDVDPPEGTDRSCADAYSALSSYIQGDFNTNWLNYLKFLLRKDNPQQAVSDAMTAVSITQNTANKFMMNALMRNLLREGTSIYTASTGEVLLASMKTQGMEQRRYQWATEQTLFKEVARPLMAFIESFVVCLAPIMCFLVVIGPVGTDLTTKYFLSIVWISLWPPVMSIVNTYIYFAATKDVALMASAAAIDPTTLAGMNSLYTTVGSWISTGGLMAASVPALTLTLVYGGAVTASALASRMQSGQHVNSNLAAPDISNAAPVVSQQSARTGSPNIGPVRTGMTGSYISYDFGRAADSALSQRNSEIHSVTQNASSAYANAFSFGKTDADSKTKTHELAESIRHSQSVADKYAVSRVESLSQSHTFSDSQRDSLTVALRAAAGMGTGSALPGPKLNIEAALGAQSAQEATVAKAIAKQEAESIAKNSDLQKSVARESSESGGTRFAHAVTKTYGAQLGKTVSQSESAVAAASQSFDQVNSLRATMGASQKFDELNFAQQMRERSVDQGASLIGAVKAMGKVYTDAMGKEFQSLETVAPGNANNQLMAAVRVLWGSESGQATLAQAYAGIVAQPATPGSATAGGVQLQGPDVLKTPSQVRAPNLDLLDRAGDLSKDGQKVATDTERAIKSSPKSITLAPPSQPVTVGGAHSSGSHGGAGGHAGPSPAQSSVPYFSAEEADRKFAESSRNFDAKREMAKVHSDVRNGELVGNKLVKDAKTNFDAYRLASNAASTGIAAVPEAVGGLLSGTVEGGKNFLVNGVPKMVDKTVDNFLPGAPELLKDGVKAGLKVAIPAAGTTKILGMVASKAPAAAAAANAARAGNVTRAAGVPKP